jgi:hypothetical protein
MRQKCAGAPDVDSAVVHGKQTRSVNLFETVARGLHYRCLRRSPLPTWPSRRKIGANMRWHRKRRRFRQRTRESYEPSPSPETLEWARCNFLKRARLGVHGAGRSVATKPPQRPSIARLDGGHRHRGRYVVSR